jgi:2-haloalkanoic acid dehalogenase type II
MASSSSVLPLTSFKALSFDCFGTLIDWESGLATDLEPVLSQLPEDHIYRETPLLAVKRFNNFSEQLWREQPTLKYDANLATSFKMLAAELGVEATEDGALGIGNGPGRWPAFEDTVDGLQRLGKHYKLIILSNVNNQNIARTTGVSLAPARFDAVYTAENIGSYKPSLNNFHYLFAHAKKDFGIDFEAGDLLHVAHSLSADHVPAKQLGLRSVWIARRSDEENDHGTGGNLEELTAQNKLAFEWRFKTIGQFADEVDRQFASTE